MRRASSRVQRCAGTSKMGCSCHHVWHDAPMNRALVLLALVGCGGYDKDWSGKALEPKQVEIEGVKLTINVPKGLPRDDDEKPGTWSVTKVEGDHVPKIFLGIEEPRHADVEEFARWEILNKEKMNLVRKET